MDKKYLLQEVNKLVSSGLRKSAIDLINEYLQDVPNDSSVLNVLARIYFLENKQEQAIKYLQLSLQSNSSSFKEDTNVATYNFDELDDEDFNYIANSSNANDLDFSYADMEAYSLSTISGEIHQQETEQPLEDDFSQIDIDTLDSEDNHIEFDYKEKDWDFNIDIFDSDLSSYRNYSDEALVDLTEDMQDVNNHDEVDEDEYIFGKDEIVIENEFDWNDPEEFDDFNEIDFTSHITNYRVAGSDKLSREERSRQIATELIHTYDWGIENLELLQRVFYEYGWSVTKIAIEQELIRGLEPLELEIAMFIRKLWTDNQQYWISFFHVVSNQSGQQTRDAYKSMSWRESLRIIRVFNQTPSEEEILLFIDQVYDDWYCSPRLQKKFKSFIRYLKYRTGSVKHTLSAKEIFSFVSCNDEDEDVNNGLNLAIFGDGRDSFVNE